MGMMDGDRKKILVVDDEIEHADMVEMRLVANNYEVLRAVDGLEGVERAVQEKPDLILLDLMMPRMDGYTALQRLKSEPTTRKIPVIILSAKGETDSIFMAQDLRATDYLIKPFEDIELLEMVAKYLTTKGS